MARLPALESLNDPTNPGDAAYWLAEMQSQYADLGQEWGPKESDHRGLRARQARVLAAYVRTAAIVRSAAAGPSTYGTTLKWRHEDPVYQPLWPVAEQAAAEVLRAEARRRAVDGVSITIRDRHGVPIGEERKYSDRMLETLLKMYDPDRRLVAKSESGAVTDDAWRQRLAKMVDDPKALAALEVLADHMVAEVQPEVS